VAVVKALAILAPDLDDKATGRLVALVTRRGYTEAELAYASEEILYDPEVDRKLQFGNEITAADFERTVVKIRTIRALLRQPLDRSAINRLIEQHPGLISADDFGITGYTAADTPLYRFCRDGKPVQLDPMPQLPEATHEPRSREGTGTTMLGESLRSFGDGQ
jgi:hypothetical protein